MREQSFGRGKYRFSEKKYGCCGKNMDWKKENAASVSAGMGTIYSSLSTDDRLLQILEG